MAKSSRRIKLSKNMRPFVSRVVRDGIVQKAFAEQIGHPIGQCVAEQIKSKKLEAERKGKKLSGAEIHNIAKECASKSKGLKLHYVGV